MGFFFFFFFVCVCLCVPVLHMSKSLDGKVDGLTEKGDHAKWGWKRNKEKDFATEFSRKAQGIKLEDTLGAQGAGSAYNQRPLSESHQSCSLIPKM